MNSLALFYNYWKSKSDALELYLEKLKREKHNGSKN
jgi:hypothetical protein